MSGNLVSPGVQVNVIDQSFYASAGPGTVPFIMMATAANKFSPGSRTTIAPGTVKANADSLYLVTSQRELIQTFGTPGFLTQAGTPQNGSELNEYGLYAAYQYLGLANSAYVMRADVDLAALAPTSVEPAGSPLNGDHWLNLTDTTWGVFRGRGNPNPALNWAAVEPLLISNSAQLQRVITGEFLGADRITDVTHVVVPADVPLVIQGETVALKAGSSLSDVASAINLNTALNRLGITAQVVERDELFASGPGAAYNLQIVSKDINRSINFDTTVSNTAFTQLGFATIEPPNSISPVASFGQVGDIAVNAVGYDTTADAVPPGVAMYEKIATVSDNTTMESWFLIGSDAWTQARPTVVTGTTNLNPNSSLFTNGSSFDITIGTVNQTITLGADSNAQALANAINSSYDQTNAWVSLAQVGSSVRLVITNFSGTKIVINDGNITPMVTAGIATGTTWGSRLKYQGYSRELPQPSDAEYLGAHSIWINTQPGNRGANWVVDRYNISSGSWTPQTVGIYADDASASSGFGSNRKLGSIYVQYDPTEQELAQFYVNSWSGTSWVTLPDPAAPQLYTQSLLPPSGPAETGTLWYNTNLKVDILYGTGSMWEDYRNQFPDTDSAGAILSASAPSYQSDGKTSLVDNDLWINTSDLENYPRISRWDSFSNSWILIDNTDHVSSAGIVFADARPSNTGDLDADAPSALTYPTGMLLFNTRYSTYNVKRWNSQAFTDPTTGRIQGRWVTASGLMENGVPYMGRQAQRIMIVEALKKSIINNDSLRSENNFYNLIAAPGYPELLETMVSLNSDIHDVAFVVGDAPARLRPDGTSVQNWARNTAQSPEDGELGRVTYNSYASTYYPWGLATNLDGVNIFVPPSTAVLRTIAFNDQVSYPWFAPAGFNRGLVSVFSSVGYIDNQGTYTTVALNQGQRDVLYNNDINPIAYIPGRGLVIYGQKTLDPLNTALNRVNVARLVNYLNYQLNNLAKPYLFEPNDQVTRASVTQTFSNFMSDLVNVRAVYDFAVQCDSSNNTASVIDQNQLYIDIAIKPEKAIEFIYIPLRILNTGAPLPNNK
jgi:hypothetical protein